VGERNGASHVLCCAYTMHVPPQCPPDQAVRSSGVRVDEDWPDIHRTAKEVGCSFLAAHKENLHAVHGELAHFHAVTCKIPQPDLQTGNQGIQIQDAYWLSLQGFSGTRWQCCHWVCLFLHASQALLTFRRMVPGVEQCTHPFVRVCWD
jgi:hypothetical protein